MLGPQEDHNAYSKAYRDEMTRNADDWRLAKQARKDRQQRSWQQWLYSAVGRRMVRVGIRLLISAQEWEQRAGELYDGWPANDVAPDQNTP